MQLTFLAPLVPSRAATLIRNQAVSPRRPRPVHGAVAAKSVWVERSATVIIETTPEESYDSYIDLQAMPTWYVFF